MGASCSGESEYDKHQHQATNPQCKQHLSTNRALMKSSYHSKRYRIRQQSHSSNYQSIFTLKSSKETISIKLPVFHPKYLNLGSSQNSTIQNQLIENGLRSAESMLYHPICSKLTYKGKLNQCATHLIDSFDQGNDLQVHLKYEVFGEGEKNQKYVVKMYPYESIDDQIFKQGLYELYLYRSLLQNQKNSPWLHHAYSLQKGKIKTLVFTYNSYLCSLFDILQYRKQAKYPYTNNQQIYIAHQLIKNYRILDMNRIAHRDIRPSKIFIFDPISLQEEQFPKNTTEQSYQFVNLESARKITDREYQVFFENDRKLSLTPCGVPHYSSEYLRESMINYSRNFEYDFQLQDRYQLANVLSALVTLNPFQNETQIKRVRKKNKELSFIIEKLKDIQIINIDSLFQYTTKLISKIDTIRTINCPKKLKYELSSAPNGILTSDYDIATGLLNRALYQKNQERYKKVEEQSMLALMQQHLYSPLLHKKIEDTYKKIQEDSKQNEQHLKTNIAALHRIGVHYQKLGVQNNDYIRQEINCILKLCEIHRIYGYETEQQLLNANRLYRQRLSKKIRTPITKYRLVIENSYMLLNRNQKQLALKQINKLCIPYKFENTKLAQYFSRMPNQIQLNAYEGKIVMEGENHKFEMYEIYCERAIQICREEKRWKDFSRFTYLLGKYGLAETEMWKNKNVEEQKIMKKVDKCEKTLIQAQQLFNKQRNSSNDDIILLAHILETKGDLQKFMKNYKQAMKNYQSSYTLLLSSQKPVSLPKRNALLKKMSQLFELDEFSYEERVWIQERLVLNLGCENLAGKEVNESEFVAESEVAEREIEMSQNRVNTVSSEEISGHESQHRREQILNESEFFPFKSSKTNLQPQKLQHSFEQEQEQPQDETQFRKKKRISTRLSLLY